MKKQFLMFAALLIVSLAALAQGQKRFNLYAVGFYNQENLFDTCHDEGKNDYEYLPAKGWNGMKYTNKLHNMARALADMGTDKLPKVGCAFIGMAEVENHKVLDDLIAQEPLKARGMKYCHSLTFCHIYLIKHRKAAGFCRCIHRSRSEGYLSCTKRICSYK